ncbi:DUF5641 domain-containing protein [Trichonephila clavata]|uniref:DUF5641 domain-containing protein n=1 Tax=Trichonephila clavata TaxID=2740835 RepID=A0A8X6J6L0_TRICU|nr:DUF5641 domain-containing protein [Trichonephila clavata]
MEVLPTKHWRHVLSKENLADIASRGIDPKCLPDCMFWWQGPPWLRLETFSCPKTENSFDEALNVCVCVRGGDDVLLSVPEKIPSTSNHINCWELLQSIKRGFWKKWSSDFLSSLQPRKKWQVSQPNLKEHDIVLIKEKGPPGTWPMTRVLQVHPGNDELVRVATVKTPFTNDMFINSAKFLYIRTSSDIG